jgi:uncharacterized damage-inducible protein DinB
MEQLKLYYTDWKKRYIRVQNHRIAMWKDLCNPEVKPDWIITRPKKHQWAIDEIIRHMLASEIRYIHQSFNPDIIQINEAVKAQWVQNRFFRIKEDNHVKLERLKEISLSIENETVKYLDSPNEAYEKKVKAPWGEEMKVFELLEAFYTHEFYHQGQVYCLLTLFRGLPKIIESQITQKT